MDHERMTGAVDQTAIERVIHEELSPEGDATITAYLQPATLANAPTEEARRGLRELEGWPTRCTAILKDSEGSDSRVGLPRACWSPGFSLRSSKHSAITMIANHQQAGVTQGSSRARVQCQPHDRGTRGPRHPDRNYDEPPLPIQEKGHSTTAASLEISPVYSTTNCRGRSSTALRYTSSRSLLS